MNRTGVLFTLFLLMATVFPAMSPVFSQAKMVFITVGTGGITGVYYPTGSAICKRIARETGCDIGSPDEARRLLSLNPARKGLILTISD